jgi:predicted nucleotidyltransferase/DNA-binding XRE family transcriptional regulator
MLYLNRYNIRMDAASLIKRARKDAGLTQHALAEAAGTSQPTLAAYECGAKSPSVKTLNRLIRAAGASLDVRIRRAPAAQGDLLDKLRSRRRAIQASADRHLIRNVRVFGSTARGAETSRSDIDLLVDFDAAKHGVMPLVDFASDVSRIAGRKVDVSTTELLKDSIRRRALAEAVPL